MPFTIGADPTIYSRAGFPPILDKQLGYVIVPAILAGILYIIIFPAIKQWKKRFYIISMCIVSSFILLGIFGYNWDVATATVFDYKYTPYSGKAINASVGVYIGLGGYNVTLIGEPVTQLGETINFNEELLWEWDQITLNRRYEEFTLKGAPIPILDTAQYLVLDGEHIQFGRLYRYGGYYCYILLWLAFSIWCMSFLMAFANWEYSASKYAGEYLVYSGLTQFMAIMVWYFTKPTLEIPLSEDATLQFSLGWSFYVIVVSMIISVIQGSYLYFTFKNPEDTYENVETKKKEASIDGKKSTKTPMKNEKNIDMKVIQQEETKGNNINQSSSNQASSSVLLGSSDALLGNNNTIMKDNSSNIENMGNKIMKEDVQEKMGEKMDEKMNEKIIIMESKATLDTNTQQEQS